MSQLALLLLAAVPFLLTIAPAHAQGLTDVAAWAYQLQEIDPQEIAANETFDLIVIDYSSDGGGEGEWTPELIALIQESGKRVLSYISIGEAEDYRFYWDPQWESDPPPWLGPENPDWEGNYKVRFWHPAWRAIVESYLDRIVGQGFDGIYMDLIDAYYYWSEEDGERPDADSLMVEFVAQLRDYLTAHHGLPEMSMVPQNGEFIIVEDDVSPMLRDLYLDCIDAIGVEDVFCPGDLDEDNPFDPDSERITMLAEYQAEGKPVFSIEYLTRMDLIEQYVAAAFAADHRPHVSLRALDVLMNGIHPDSAAPEDEPVGPGTRLRIWPNPGTAGRSVSISLRMPECVMVSGTVHDPLGRLVRHLPVSVPAGAVAGVGAGVAADVAAGVAAGVPAGAPTGGWLGQETVLVWDGCDSVGRSVAGGVYQVCFRYTWPGGSPTTVSRSVVLLQ
jgi:cysteinyl-tRNA synthetase